MGFNLVYGIEHVNLLADLREVIVGRVVGDVRDYRQLQVGSSPGSRLQLFRALVLCLPRRRGCRRGRLRLLLLLLESPLTHYVVVCGHRFVVYNLKKHRKLNAISKAQKAQTF